jgi:hypothetical protein
MKVTAMLRFMKRAAIASIAAAGMQAYAVDVTMQDMGAVTDAYNPPPGNPLVSAVPDSGGAGFTALFITNDQTRLVMSFLSGQLGSGESFPNCSNNPPIPWTLTLALDGTVFYTLNAIGFGNAVDNPPSLPQCGFNFTFFKAAQYDVLPPGTYQIKVTSGADTMAQKTLVLSPCLRPIDVYSAYHSGYTDISTRPRCPSCSRRSPWVT